MSKTHDPGDDRVIWVHELSLWQQVQIGLGEYWIAFSNLEGTLISTTAALMGMKHSALAYILRDVQFQARLTLFRRSVSAAVPDEGFRKRAIALANRAGTAAEFRNRVAHASFIHHGELGITMVKDGEHPFQPLAGGEAINYETFAQKSRAADLLSSEFSSWLREWNANS
ncbi:hypothetical protein [Flaviflagellibacter deserti]|uniref:Uncharacterized protein n=1 Tax=Flaviflagellibacter deserti TaxID=2267266 RepID=A0ABV9YXN9_9HYPH